MSDDRFASVVVGICFCLLCMAGVAGCHIHNQRVEKATKAYIESGYVYCKDLSGYAQWRPKEHCVAYLTTKDKKE